MQPKIVFMGSPDFAVPILQALASHYPVVGVVTQPDRPAGRGQTLCPPPVKVLAQKLGLDIVQPEKMKDPECQEKLHTWKPEVIVVAAFGKILRQNVLDLPPYGCVNVHASLLPRWRGAAPVQAAILAGDRQSGATIMLMDPGIDTGPMLAQSSVEISPQDTGGSLSEKLADAGANLLINTLPLYLEGALLPQPQPEDGATYAPMLKKEDGQLDFSQPADSLANRVRAFDPWPGTYTWLDGQMLKVLRARPSSESSLQPGKRGIVENLPAFGTAGGCLLLEELQPAGKKPMNGKDFLRGARSWKQD